MLNRKESTITWIDIVFLVFVVGLAVLPPIHEIHKQLILLAIAVFQFFEGRLVAWNARNGAAIAVGVKIVLATLLLDHTGEPLGINSSYWPIYYLPIVTAAIYFGTAATFFWTALASAAYCSFLVPALQEYEFTPEARSLLSLRILFFFLVALLVNRFVVENRRQVVRYQALSGTLEETNRQLQRAEAGARRAERLAALGQLSAGLAHEIRNPLGVIKGSAEMLSQKLRDSEPLAGELAGYISSEVNRLNSLVARFLDFARPSRLELRPQSVAKIVDAALDSVQAESAHPNVRVERDYASSLPEILADEQLCERLFANLIVNAFQAMQGEENFSGGVLRLTIAPESHNGRNGVSVVVEDSGPGIPAEVREQIFNPFVTSKKDGLGLGLAIVAKIADDHHGSVRLENGTRRGACFRVFLPEQPE